MALGVRNGASNVILESAGFTSGLIYPGLFVEQGCHSGVFELKSCFPQL